MKPSLTDKAEMPPARCIVSGDAEGPFIDTHCYAAEVDPYIYLSVSYIKEIARDLLGMVEKAKIEELEEQVNALRAKLETQEKVEDAIKTIEEFTAEKVMA